MALPSSWMPLNAAWMPEEMRFPIATVATERPEPNLSAPLDASSSESPKSSATSPASFIRSRFSRSSPESWEMRPSSSFASLEPLPYSSTALE